MTSHRLTFFVSLFLSFSAVGAEPNVAFDISSGAGGRKTVRMLPDEKWWGLCNAFGAEMPFDAKTSFACDLRKNNYGHQALSLLVSDRGRVLWCDEPIGVTIERGEIAVESDAGEIVLKEDAGRSLPEAYRFASRTWFAPSGEEPELLYFQAPQYNTWIELTYHQNEKDVLAYAKSMLDHGLPPGILMIDDTWQRGYGVWEFEASRFGNPKGMVDALHGMGFKVVLWMCPWVSMDSPAYRLLGIGLSTETYVRQPIGGLLMNPTAAEDPAVSKWWNGKSALLDLSHPRGRAWFDGELTRLVRDYGVDAFKFDGGSTVHYTAGFRCFDPSLSPAAQARLYGDYALKYRGSEYRNVFGFAGQPVIMRLHDKDHSWPALRRLVPDMLAAGLIGTPFICPDMIGGGSWTAFLPGAPFEPELFIRSAQVHALCPMMQISASPWRVLDARHQEIFRQVAALRQRFAPEITSLAKRAAKDGEPMMHNLEYAYPGRGYAAVKDEFLMGEDLLVAPVLEKGAESRRVVIPPGRWRADDGTETIGPATVTVATPLERLPYFRRVEIAREDVDVCDFRAVASAGGTQMPSTGLCAHQGYCPRGRGIFPNTVEALKAAVAAGAEMVEFDVHPTKDGQLLVFHDQKQLDRPCRATFDEAIDCLPKTNLWINVHYAGDLGVARIVARKIKEKGRLHQAVFASIRACIKAAREEVPDLLACNMSRPKGLRPGVAYTDEQFAEYLRTTREAGCQFLQPRALWSTEAVRRAHEAGLRVIYSPHGGVGGREGVLAARRAGIDFLMVGGDELLEAKGIWTR